LIYLYENILKINKLTPEEMKTYNESVLELEQFSLFTDHAKMEGIEIGEKKGIEKGIEIGEKRGIEIGEKKGIKIGEKKGIEIGEKKGIEIGEKKGIEIAYSQIVHNAANKGISVENISNITNLSVEQVRSILRK
jgi:predicted transposase YdaD